MYIFRLVQNGKPWDMAGFFQTSPLQLEMVLRKYDDFFVLILFHHETILSAVKCFGSDTESVLIGSAFEGCFLPKNLNNGKGIGVEFDFFVSLPTPKASESPGVLQYVALDGQPHQVLVKLSNPSILESDYIGIKNTVPNLSGSFLRKGEDRFYLKRNFMEAMEDKIQNSLGKVLGQKPGGMEMVSRCETEKNSEGLQASINVLFFKPITEHLGMLPLDPDTWSGDAMTNAQMLWVNLTNWSSPSWPTKIFKVHLVLECHWPADAKMNWLQRQRYWPSEKTVHDIAEAPCYLHPLWDKEEPIDGGTLTFRMTFGVPEYLLFLETGPKERQCIIVLKAIKEKYFPDSQILSSFVIKVVFFWHLESSPLSERRDMGRGDLLVCLLDKLVRFLNSRSLPDFFIPSVNLLQHFDAGDISNTCSQVKRVKRNMLDYLSSELFQVKCSKTVNDDFVQSVLQFV